MKTKGNVKVDSIKVGDIHYEFGPLNLAIKCEVLTTPQVNESGQMEWKSKNLGTGSSITYLVDPKFPEYSPNLYDYEAYSGYDFTSW